jgi:hypothetical protein
VSEICDAAGVHCRDAAEVEDLHKGPETDQQGGRMKVIRTKIRKKTTVLMRSRG